MTSLADVRGGHTKRIKAPRWLTAKQRSKLLGMLWAGASMHELRWEFNERPERIWREILSENMAQRWMAAKQIRLIEEAQ